MIKLLLKENIRGNVTSVCHKEERKYISVSMNQPILFSFHVLEKEVNCGAAVNWLVAVMLKCLPRNTIHGVVNYAVFQTKCVFFRNILFYCFFFCILPKCAYYVQKMFMQNAFLLYCYVYLPHKGTICHFWEEE